MAEPAEPDRDPVDALAQAALARFGIGDGARVTLVNVSENHTYKVDDPGSGRSYALRLHRPGYRTVAEIESELAWIDALRTDGVVHTPRAIAAPDGARVVPAQAPGVEARNAVMFEWLDGTVVDMDDGVRALEQYERLGAISARMHEHLRGWRAPAGFTRPPWDYEHSIGPSGYWGAWQDGLGIGLEERRVLERLDETIRTRLERFGGGPERFGLIHADMRLANLLVNGSEVLLIDFDDCGASWFMYDFATTVSFMEDHPRVPELRDAWIRGYRSVAALDDASVTELQTFVMLRRLLLVAWIGSHHTFAPEAAELGAGFTAGTCALAEAYLSTH
ncbi:MAG TPA: phosphotransferase [Solirubrobacteraceae bacterium]|nr:phosphotransferase [Solirubrobacteraceae bacterium]